MQKKTPIKQESFDAFTAEQYHLIRQAELKAPAQ